MGERVPIFPKNERYQYVASLQNVKSMVGSKGLSPLAGVGAEPQKNFAYAVGFRGKAKEGFGPHKNA